MTFDGTPPCAAPGVDPELWFSEDAGDQEIAKRMCRGCPFREPCAELRDSPFDHLDAIIPRAEYGTWAGETLVPPTFADVHKAQELTPRQRKTLENVEGVRGLLGENLGKTEIGRRLGLSHGSVNHIIKTYLTPEEATE